MEIADLIFADYATINERGKFTLVGAGFTEIGTLKLPCIHPLMYIFMRVRVTHEDLGKNRVEMRLTGDQASIFKADGDLNVAGQNKGEQYVPFCFQFVNLKFGSEGEYKLEVRINGELKQSQMLRIKLIPGVK
ncbi:MAG: DUF6941 family protein [Deltaproteobacteria bacterium]